jgi:hypothetical protein
MLALSDSFRNPSNVLAFLVPLRAFGGDVECARHLGILHRGLPIDEASLRHL